MDVRYQVFISSTYEDLKEERAEVMQALLELDCMPSGMELFPAASEEQWKWIQRVIDSSDYYVVIIGGKYGSTNAETGLSYTEMEYDYAIGAKKPTIAFVIDKSVNLPESKIEIDSNRRQALDEFKAKVQKRLCKFWINTPDLGAKISRSITQLMKRDPATGWVRADALTQVDSEENLRLRNRIFELERSLAAVRPSPVDDLTTLAQGDDEYILRVAVYKTFSVEEGQLSEDRQIHIGNIWVTTTWDGISESVGHVLLGRTERDDVISELIEAFWDKMVKESKERFGENFPEKGDKITFYIAKESIDQIEIQFMALGLITLQTEKEGLPFGTGAREFWYPTRDGVRYFVRKLALKRSNPAA